MTNAEHSGLKRMEAEGLDSQKLFGAPPIMRQDDFVDWIGMADEPRVVKEWLARGYIPTLKVGKRRMVNVALYLKNLIEREEE